MYHRIHISGGYTVTEMDAQFDSPQDENDVVGAMIVNINADLYDFVADSSAIGAVIDSKITTYELSIE